MCENKGLIWLKYFLPLMLIGKMKDNVILTSSKPFLFQIQNWLTCVSKAWAVETYKNHGLRSRVRAMPRLTLFSE